MGLLPENQVRTRLPAGGGSQEANSSLNPIPCYAGKIQGISSTAALPARIGGRNSYYNQALTSKFPTQRNRELIGPYQGIKSAHQGKFPPVQGSPPFGLAFLTMVRGRASVERVGANSNKRWWRSTTRRSSPGPRCMVASLSHTSFGGALPPAKRLMLRRNGPDGSCATGSGRRHARPIERRHPASGVRGTAPRTDPGSSPWCR